MIYECVYLFLDLFLGFILCLFLEKYLCFIIGLSRYIKIYFKVRELKRKDKILSF